MPRPTLLALLACALLVCALFAPPAAAQTAVPKPVWVYGHDLRARKGGASDFDKETAKVGVEFYRDAAAGAVIAVTQAGNLAATRAAEAGADKTAPWLFALDLSVRKGDEARFTPATAKLGVEAFKDTATGKLLYLTDKATAAFADLPKGDTKGRSPAWHHAVTVKVRGPKESAFTAETKAFGVEVYRDGNTGGLIYACENGSIAAGPAPATAPKADAVKAPKALYGLGLRCRKADEANFSDATRTIGVDVYRDENTGLLLYVSETGAIAVAPPAETKTGQGVPWNYGFTLTARPGGVAEFAKGTKYGVEVFTDGNSGNTIIVSETGSIAVLSKQ
jgi:hypothetical protein